MSHLQESVKKKTLYPTSRSIENMPYSCRTTECDPKFCILAKINRLNFLRHNPYTVIVEFFFLLNRASNFQQIDTKHDRHLCKRERERARERQRVIYPLICKSCCSFFLTNYAYIYATGHIQQFLTDYFWVKENSD